MDTYNAAKSNNLLLQLEFTTVFDYLSLLEYCCKSIECLKANALIYLAAAVSDFYVPKEEMSEHKIQSDQSGLQLNLKPVPKMLGKLKSEWCPSALVVSFKLETDVRILESKCLKALARYKHDMVIGNILEERKQKVTVILADGTITTIQLDSNVNEIEHLIVQFLKEKHSNYLN